MLDRNDCKLRPMNAGDRQRVLDWRNQDRIRAAMYSDHVISPSEHDRWFDRALEATDAAYLIFEHQNRPVGFVSFTRIDRLNDRCDWAFYLGEADAPRGSGAAMEFLALDHVFDTLKIGKLCCEVFAFNAGVVRLHQRFGFQQEGRLVRHWRKDGELQDVIVLALFMEDWAAARSALAQTVFQGMTP